MGANIGTTVTAWIISALGFKVDIAAMALPLLAVGGRVTEAIWIQEVECFQKKDGKETVIPERGYTEIETHQIFY